MPERTLELEFPLGGVDRRLAYPKQRPYTTPYAVNVRPEDTREKRLRGGSRPGLVKSFAQQISGAANPIRMLSVMRTHNPEGRLTYEEDFSASLATDWDAGAWHTDGLIDVTGGQGEVDAGDYNGAVLKNGSGEPGELLSTDAPYELQCWIDPYTLSSTTLDTLDSTYLSLLARLDDATPALGSCVRAYIQYYTGASATHGLRYKAVLRLSVDGVVVDSADIMSLHVIFKLRPGTLTLKISGDVSEATWEPDPVSASYDIGLGERAVVSSTTATASTGKRVGIEADTPDTEGGDAYFDDFSLKYFSTAAGVPPEAIIASANGELWRETTEGKMTEISTYNSLSLASDRSVQAVDRLGKLYIADTSDTRIKDLSGNGVIVDGRLDDVTTPVSDWTAHGILQGNDVVELTGITGGAGVFNGETSAVCAVSLTAGAIHADNGVLLQTLNGADLGAADDCTTCKYRITRGPKVYDSVTDALTHWAATTGLVPVGCPIIELFSERAALSGDPENEHVYYMSRWGDLLDYYYGASGTDRGKAVTNAGESPESSSLSLPMSAIVALTEDYCLFSAESELYLLRGDINLGGIMGNVSRQIGIGSRTAWCRIPDGSLVYLSRNGLYKFHPSSPYPENMSRDKLPQILIDVVQNSDYVVNLEYDVRFRGVLIFMTLITTRKTWHYWFDWATQSFWLNLFGNVNYEPFSIAYDAKANDVMFGCRDGYIRRFDPSARDDDGTNVGKEVDYGPIPLNRGRAGIAESLVIVLDNRSDDVSWTFRSGNSPEEAYRAASRASGTAVAGVNYSQPIHHFGEYGFLRLSTTGAARWAVESIKMRVLTVPTESRKV